MPATLQFSIAQFNRISPFYILLDKDMKIESGGKSLEKIFPHCIGQNFGDAFSLIRPAVLELDIAYFEECTDQLFLLRCKNEHKTLLRGQVEWLPASQQLLFLVSPWVTSMEELSSQGLSLNDFSIGDPVIDMMNVKKTHEIVSDEINQVVSELNIQKARLISEKKELQRLSFVAKANSNGVIFTEPGGQITWTNEGFANMTGYAIHEILGRNPLDLFRGPLSNKEAITEMVRNFVEGKNYSVEVIHYRKDGSWFWGRTSGQAVLDENGKLIEYFSIIEDITDTRSRMEEIRTLSTIAERNKSAIIMTDKDRRISWVNNSFQQITGYSLSESVGANPRELLSGPLSDNNALEVLRKKIESNEVFDAEVLNYRKNGQPYWARLHGQALFDSKGEFSGYFAMHEDITLEKEAQQKIKSSDERLRNALDKIGDNVWEHDFKTGHTFFSKKMNPLLNADTSDVEQNAKLWWDSIHPDDFQLLDQVKLALQKGEIDSHATEYRVISKDGSRKWVLDRGVVIEKDEKGLPLKIIGTHTDITKIKQLETELSQRVQQFESLSENIPGVIFEFEIFEDGKEQLRYVSPSLKRIFDIDAEDFYDFDKYVHPEDLSRIKGKVKRSGLTLEPYYDESRLVVKGKDIMWRAVSASFSYIAESGAKVFTGFMTNITEQKKAADLLHRKEEKYRSIITNMHLGLLEVDTQERIQHANQSFCEMSGYSLQELVGKTASSLFLKGESLQLMEQKNESRRKGLSDAYELAVMDKNNQVKWWLVSGAPTYDDNGELSGTIGIHLDITEQKGLEEELIGARIQAENSVLAKEVFLANMSHEIRTPMNAIIGMSNQLARTNLDSRQQFFLDTIHSAADNLLVIINDILDLSKIEAGKLSIESIGFEPREMVTKVMQVMMHKAEEKGLSFTNSFQDPYMNKVLIGDPYRISQVILNLVSNAIKFTEKGSVDLSFALKKVDERKCLIKVAVTDTGIGMDEKFLSAIFNKFSQESQSITREYGGTGLGMSICKQLIELMGGTIKVESRKNLGTRVSFSITLACGTTDDLPKKESILINNSILSDKKVLVTDDNEMNRLVASMLLQQHGAEVMEAANGREAVALMEKEQVDLVLMDIQMPVMNGLEATQVIRKSLRLPVPVIALTANALKGESDRCIAAGMNDYISKPFTEEVFIKTIAKWLGKEIELETSGEVLATDVPLFDLSRLEEISRGNQDFIRKMVGLFLQQVPPTVKEISKMAQELQLEKMSSLAHRIKPSIDNLRIIPIIPVIREIEGWKKINGNEQELFSRIRQLDEVIEQVVRQLERRIGTSE